MTTTEPTSQFDNTEVNFQTDAAISEQLRYNWKQFFTHEVFLIQFTSGIVLLVVGLLLTEYVAKAEFAIGGAFASLVASLLVGMIFVTYYQLYKENKKVALLNNRILRSITKQKNDLDRSRIEVDRDEQARAIIASQMTDSVFTGALGSFLEESKGNIETGVITKKRYLDLISEAILPGIECLTLQPSGLAWFRDNESYLNGFSAGGRKCMRILVADEATIHLEEADEELVYNYLYCVGPNTDTFWITKRDFLRLYDDLNARGKVPAEESPRVLGEHTDVVICTGTGGKGQIVYQFTEHGGSEKGVAKCWHTADNTADRHPYKWVFSSLAQERESDPNNKYFRRLKQTYRWDKSLWLNDSIAKVMRIDLKVLANNYRYICSVSGSVRKIIVIKGNAYGLGIREVLACLLSAGARDFGVASISEADQARDLMIARRLWAECTIILMESFDLADAEPCIRNEYECFVWDKKYAKCLSDEYAIRTSEPRHGTTLGRPRIHVKVDTGMNRLGVKVSELSDFLHYLKGLPHLNIVGIASHLAIGERPNDIATVHARKLFSEAIAIAGGILGQTVHFHIANTAAFLRAPEMHYQSVRIGGLLYGMGAIASKGDECYSPQAFQGLRDVFHVAGRIMRIRDDISRDEKVSYAAPGGKIMEYKVAAGRKLAVVNMGYNDGVPFDYYKAGKVLIAGIKCDVVGTVCMHMTIVDVSKVRFVKVGDEVVFVGSSGDQSIRINEIADWVGSTPYKIIGDFTRHLVDYITYESDRASLR